MNRLANRWRKSTIGRSSTILTKRDKKLVLFVIVIQVTMGFLDLAAIAILGVLGALAVNGIESKQPGNRVGTVLNYLDLANKPFQHQVAVLAALAAFLLIARTVFSIIFSRRILYFLSRRGALISSRLISALLSQPLIFVQRRTNQEIVYAVTHGVSSITLGVLGTGVNLVSDSSLLIIIATGLFLVDPWIALGSFAVFGSIAYLLYMLLHKRAAILGQIQADLTIKSNEKILEVLNSYREAVVRNRREFYAREISVTRLELANTLAELTFMPLIGKYVVESTVVLGALTISGIQFVTSDAAHAISTLTVFLAAGSRIAPAVLRIQQSLIQLKGGLGTAKPTLELIESLDISEDIPSSDDVVHTFHKGFISNIKLTNVSFSYPNQSRFAIDSINLEILDGYFVAVVGPSGAGKTTLVDLLLGVLEPSSGDITISGATPREASSKWPGAIGYVPQNVMIANGSIKQNVGLGYPDSEIKDELVSHALQLAQLSTFISELKNGFDTEAGESGNKLSGGQRQRLGISRALFTHPKIIVFDEATSALDGETEANISSAIESLKGDTTVIMIAHRLSTVRKANKVIYMSKGEIVAVGTFEEVRSLVPDFDRQAKLMGL